MPLTPEQRSLRSRLAAFTMHSRNDSGEIARRAQRGLLARFEREVDPTDSLSPVERERRPWSLYRAHMLRLSLASARKRRAAKRTDRG